MARPIPVVPVITAIFPVNSFMAVGTRQSLVRLHTAAWASGVSDVIIDRLSTLLAVASVGWEYGAELYAIQRILAIQYCRDSFFA